MIIIEDRHFPGVSMEFGGLHMFLCTFTVDGLFNFVYHRIEPSDDRQPVYNYLDSFNNVSDVNFWQISS